MTAKSRVKPVRRFRRGAGRARRDAKAGVVSAPGSLEEPVHPDFRNWWVDPGEGAVWLKAWEGLYEGRYSDGSLAYAGAEQSQLVLGPPRSGKTSGIVIPCVLDAPAAVVATSTKPDVLQVTSHYRARMGTCWVFDPTGSVDIPPWCVPLRWSPITGCERFEAAVSMAHGLASAARPGASLSEAAHWVERAEALLAPLLHAAAIGHRDMAAVCRWVLAHDLAEPAEILGGGGSDMASVVLAGVLATEERERSGILSTAAGLLGAYRSEGALAAACAPNFSPWEFAASLDALYICSPAHAQEQLAPLVVALLEQLRAAIYARPDYAAPVVYALDEVANIAPLPSLPAIAAEGGGQHLVTLACLQDLSQARARWGPAADGFFSLFSTKVIFPGIGDRHTIELVSALAGDARMPTHSYNQPQVPFLAAMAGVRAVGSVTHSSEWRPRLPVSDVARGMPGCVLAIRPDAPIGYHQLQPWWLVPRWRALALGPGR
jgi:type IV secretory pathway TraG/TraD family ATPase VirD4